eukprot:6197826-Pleurochrysis_carterae.AAC.1
MRTLAAQIERCAGPLRTAVCFLCFPLCEQARLLEAFNHSADTIGARLLLLDAGLWVQGARTRPRADVEPARRGDVEFARALELRAVSDAS